jgi:hypothetical protein
MVLLLVFHLGRLINLNMIHNGLRANEGRETKALNFKPNTNLKEISEPSN